MATNQRTYTLEEAAAELSRMIRDKDDLRHHGAERLISQVEAEFAARHTNPQPGGIADTATARDGDAPGGNRAEQLSQLQAKWAADGKKGPIGRL